MMICNDNPAGGESIELKSLGGGWSATLYPGDCVITPANSVILVYECDLSLGSDDACHCNGVGLEGGGEADAASIQ